MKENCILQVGIGVGIGGALGVCAPPTKWEMYYVMGVVPPQPNLKVDNFIRQCPHVANKNLGHTTILVGLVSIPCLNMVAIGPNCCMEVMDCH